MAEVDTAAIRTLGEQLEQVVGGDLDRIATMFQETRGIEHTNFTSVAWTLAIAYVGAVEYTEETLKTKREDVTTKMRDNLKTVADNWDRAEQHSTIQVR